MITGAWAALGQETACAALRRDITPQGQRPLDTCQPAPPARPLGAALAVATVWPRVRVSGGPSPRRAGAAVFLPREQSPLQGELSCGGSWHFGEKAGEIHLFWSLS